MLTALFDRSNKSFRNCSNVIEFGNRQLTKCNHYVALRGECSDILVTPLTTAPDHVPNVTKLCMFEPVRLSTVDIMGLSSYKRKAVCVREALLRASTEAPTMVSASLSTQFSSEQDLMR